MLRATAIAASALVLLAGCHRMGSSDRTTAVEIPVRTELYLTLDDPLDSAKAKTGDRVTGRLQSPVVAAGADAIPAGTKFNLRVKNSQVAAEQGAVGLITLEVESFDLNGREYPVRATQITESTKPMPRTVDPKAPVPNLPLRQDQAQANVLIAKDRILPFVTTEAFQVQR